MRLIECIVGTFLFWLFGQWGTFAMPAETDKMSVWLQYLTLILSVVAILGLLGAVLCWKRLIDLLEKQCGLSREIIPLLEEMPKTMGILTRLESASEESRLSDDLLAVGVKQIGEHASAVAADLRDSHSRADLTKGSAGEAADAAAQLSKTEKIEIAAEKVEINLKPE